MSFLISIGDNSVREISSHTEEDAERGLLIVTTFEGDQDALKTEAHNVRLNLGKAVVYPYEGPVYRMDVTYPSGDGFTESWERVTEFTQVDIRSSPKRITAAATSATLNLWVKQIQDAIDAGTGLTGTVDPAEQDLFDQMSRGEKSIEVDRIVFRRRRVFPINFAEGRSPSAIPQVYTTAAFAKLFAVPAGVQAILPADPGNAPSGTQWTWKVRTDDLVLIPFERKAEEVIAFTYAAWATGDYDVVTVPVVP